MGFGIEYTWVKMVSLFFTVRKLSEVGENNGH